MFLRLLRLAPASIAFPSVLMIAPVAATAQVRDPTVLATPGSTTTAVRVGMLRLFTAVTGVVVADVDFDGSIEQLRSRKDADLALLRGDVLAAACDEGLLEKVDWPTVGGRDHYPAFATSDCGIGATLSATVLAWDRDKFQGTPTWGDFWDIAKYPGKRALRRGARGNLEVALMADGVSAGDVYRTLRSADGVDRAFRKLDQLRPYLVWWDTEAQAIELIGSGEALMGSVPAAEALVGNRDGGRRFGLQWGGALIAMESWAVLKGAAQGKMGQQIVYFAGTPAIEARMLTASGVAGVAKGAADGVATDVVAASPASGAVVSGGLPIDEGFWRENGEKLGQRFFRVARALTTAKPADIAVRDGPGATEVAFSGFLDAAGTGPLWRRTMTLARAARERALVFDLSGVTGLDTAGAAFLLAAERAHGSPATVRSAAEHVQGVIDRVRASSVVKAGQTAPVPGFTVAGIAVAGLRAATGGIAFLGEAIVAVARMPGRRRMVRFSELMGQADQAGVRAIPLVLMMGFLIGLILAFQSAIPMRKFGAELYTASLVAISLLRELGPLLAAVILSGRTGSAFAAEIGTMKVNEEIDALVTMGLDPVTMLVLPRIAAAAMVMPALALTLELAGLAGMATVMMAFGFPPVAIARQVSTWATLRDLFGGLFKAVVFGVVIAGIGCRAGLATGVGPRAVGLSATSAVVGGIVATIVIDGIFALLFYKLGL